jgi:hypothetical protein
MENDVEPNLNQVVKLIPERPTILRYYNIFLSRKNFTEIGGSPGYAF